MINITNKIIVTNLKTVASLHLGFGSLDDNMVNDLRLPTPCRYKKETGFPTRRLRIAAVQHLTLRRRR